MSFNLVKIYFHEIWEFYSRLYGVGQSDFFSRRHTNVCKMFLILRSYIFALLNNMAVNLCYFINFKVLFPVVTMNFTHYTKI